MASSLAAVYSLLFFAFTTFIALSTFTTSTTAISTAPRRLVIKLIHRDSIHSPYYNQNDTVSSRVERAMNSSFARFAYLQEKIRRTINPIDNDFQAHILPSSLLFLVNFSMGQPSIPQFAVMDTGSSLLWVKCLPCERCYQQFGPLFDPSKSSTYGELPCNSEYCRYAPGGQCNSDNQCIYKQTYVNGPSSAGVIATEQLTFETSDDGYNVLPNVIFGCGHENGNFPDPKFTGIFGLGFGKTSPVTKLGSKFSYCIGNMFDSSYTNHKLILGSDAEIEGYSTPLEPINNHYYVTLEGISVGEKLLNIDPDVFKVKTEGKGGVIMDTGSPASWLVKDGFEALRDEVQGLLDFFLRRHWVDHDTICYEGTMSRDLVGFPDVTFHFAGGADLVLDTRSLFYQAEPDFFCVAVFPSGAHGRVDYDDLNVIGMMAQQYYNVAYDVEGKTLSFQRIDCQILDD